MGAYKTIQRIKRSSMIEMREGYERRKDACASRRGNKLP